MHPRLERIAVDGLITSTDTARPDFRLSPDLLNSRAVWLEGDRGQWVNADRSMVLPQPPARTTTAKLREPAPPR